MLHEAVTCERPMNAIYRWIYEIRTRMYFRTIRSHISRINVALRARVFHAFAAFLTKLPVTCGLVIFVLVLFPLSGGTTGAEEIPCDDSTQAESPGGTGVRRLVHEEWEEAREEPGEDSEVAVQQAGCVPDVYGFARVLFEKERWDQAITEFQRFCFLCPKHPLVPKARLAVGVCYEKLGRLGEAVTEFQTLARDEPTGAAGKEALFRIGEAFYRAAQYERARIALERFLEKNDEASWKWDAMYRIAWSSLKLHAFAVAREQFSALACRENPYRQPAEDVVSMIDQIKELPYRSPVLAGVLSALLPGSGHVYAGAYKDGFLAFLVNGALIVASYEAFDKEVYGAGGLTAFLSLTFYAGNIYGAVNSAHHANQERLAALLRASQSQYEWIRKNKGVEKK